MEAERLLLPELWVSVLSPREPPEHPSPQVVHFLPWATLGCPSSLSAMRWRPPRVGMSGAFTTGPPTPGTCQAEVPSSSHKGTNPIQGPHPHDFI